VLEFSWTESGGPAPSTDPQPGFGVRLIERALGRELGGEAGLTFAPEGLRFRLSAPLSPRLSLG